MAKTIISAALTGAVTPKSLTPHIPITPREIADDAIRVWKEGAAIVHLHMRNEEGRGSLETARFKEAVDRIRDNTDLVLNLSTSGGGNVSDEKRFEHVVTLLPEIASYDVGTFNWLPGGIFPNSPDFLRKCGRALIQCGPPWRQVQSSWQVGPLHNKRCLQDQHARDHPLQWLYTESEDDPLRRQGRSRWTLGAAWHGVE